MGESDEGVLGTRRNVGLLAACQAMLLTNNSTLIAINGLAGLALAPHRSLATLPVTCWVLGGACGTMPASLHMSRVGRRRGLRAGTVWGIAGALLCGAAVWRHSFALLCLGALVVGVYNAYGQYYRFTAAEVASADFKATAISLVLAGGLVGGILGPTTSRLTVGLFEPRFLGAYLALVLFALITMVLLGFLHVPASSSAVPDRPGRPLREIVAQPKFAVAVTSSAVGFGVMNFLMTSTPIAMGTCGHAYPDTAFVISSHVVAMYAPSFFTGPLIRRFGVLAVMLAGACLNLLAIGIALGGQSLAQFWWALVTLGLGWNFLYVGGTTLLTETYRPEERARAQGAGDQVVFAVMAVSSLTSGMAVTAGGWSRVNLLSLPFVAGVAVVIAWYALRKAPSPGVLASRR